MAWSYPVDCVTPAQRIEYGYRCQELLRQLHNVMGTWYREGITQTLYGKLPAKVQTRFPYAAQLTLEQWKDFLNCWDAWSNKVVNIIIAQRGLLKDSTAWTINLEGFM